ncbi:ABC transporter ATP-binding protein [Desulfosarcina alkanivorans]|uniref:ABC transporter ATP-binding protein n=1 Tax=Desulfosarcina alkanivorans TaxID=571177 RepID=A0A5K7YM52_9BACT|nr:ATP-binding cassette domain-containing protein [Desulfosarcina alkanivorans]BBO68929.1 ABC transporter ATP-binding protein [Desulfosarcina alkanivorans]
MELNTGLACRRLDFRWPGKQAEAPPVLESVEAQFSPGTVNLVTGATGSGKSTLLHLLAGLLRPTAGEIWADGQPVSRWPSRHRDAWRQQTGIVFQHLALIPDLTVAENLVLPLIPRQIVWSRIQARIHRQLAVAGLSDLADTPASALSGGQRQRVAMARGLVVRPRFLLADEPTAFQDDDHALQIGEMMAAAAHDGAVVVVCSHDPRLRSSHRVDRRFLLDSASLVETPDSLAAP